MFKYSKLDYDNFYSSEHCTKENAEIKAILDLVCCDKDTVLDLGSGTGLVASMLGSRCHVIQVEKDPNMRLQNPYPNFFVCDAYRFVIGLMRSGKSYDHVVSVFALNYMRKGTLTLACRVARKECVFVVYDKPYLAGSSSFYAGKRFRFRLKCSRKVRSIGEEIVRLSNDGYDVTVKNLNNEPYYKVITVRRRKP